MTENMLNINRNLSIIKSKKLSDIIKYIDKYAINDPQKNDIVEAYKKKNIDWGFSDSIDKNIIYIEILLAIILADIGSQLSPYLRDVNLLKIKKVAEKFDIKFEKLIRMSGYISSLHL